MKKYPKIKSVKPLRGKRLLVTFQNNIQKIYDCNHLLKEEAFSPLKNDFLFKSAKVDQGGYGVIWNDEIDLSESEIWINGSLAEQGTQPDLAGAGRQTKPNSSRRKTG